MKAGVWSETTSFQGGIARDALTDHLFRFKHRGGMIATQSVCAASLFAILIVVDSHLVAASTEVLAETEACATTLPATCFLTRHGPH